MLSLMGSMKGSAVVRRTLSIEELREELVLAGFRDRVWRGGGLVGMSSDCGRSRSRIVPRSAAGESVKENARVCGRTA